MRMRALGVAMVAGSCLGTSAALADALMTRIETRPFYGATVTLEEGVRVFRPLPRHERVIINPNGQTPLSLSFNETREYSFHHSTVEGSVAAPADFPAYYGDFGSVLPRGHRGRGHHFGRRGFK
jgi:hypothetical protein